MDRGEDAARPLAVVALSGGMDSCVTAALAAFGRAISEIGAVLVVGGNIDGYTRTMTTAISLETHKGDLSLALALGLVLIGLVLVVNVAVALLRRHAARVYG